MQRDRHLASGDLCRKGAPLGQGALLQRRSQKMGGRG
jgi:hypothetical protein